MSRYSVAPPPSFGASSAFGPPEAPKPRRKDPLEDFLRMGSAVAPALGGVAGGIIGTAVGPGLGTAAGAGLGTMAGMALGGVGNHLADGISEPDERAENERVARENERQARAMAAMQLLR